MKRARINFVPFFAPKAVPAVKPARNPPRRTRTSLQTENSHASSGFTGYDSHYGAVGLIHLRLCCRKSALTLGVQKHMNLKAFRICLLLTLALVPASFLSAQQSIKCESNNGGRKYCGQFAPNQIRLDRQISGSPCIQGRTWGVDGRGLWVDSGCRAMFVARGGPGYGPGGPGRPGPMPGPGNGPGGGWWHQNPNDRWPPQGNWNGGNWNSGGACFYKDPNFRGDYFCLRRGETRDAIGGMGDRISSIRSFGGASVTVFDDRGFSGARSTIGGSAPDLRAYPVRQKPGHTWNDRISSVRVR